MSGVKQKAVSSRGVINTELCGEGFRDIRGVINCRGCGLKFRSGAEFGEHGTMIGFEKKTGQKKQLRN